jgi:hypothetical protein
MKKIQSIFYLSEIYMIKNNRISFKIIYQKTAEKYPLTLYLSSVTSPVFK